MQVEAEHDLNTLDGIIAWHRDRMMFFSHEGLPWGKMSHDSKQIMEFLEKMRVNNDSFTI